MNYRRYLISIVCVTIAICLSDAQTVFNINRDKKHQTIDHFGASDAWSMQNVGLMPDSITDNIARLLFSTDVDNNGDPEGIGLSLWRFNIGAGSAEQGKKSHINKPTRTECFLKEDGSYDFTKQKGQRNFIKLAKKYGVPYILGFLNSPPVYFTKNGLATNTGRDSTYNLKENCYDDYAAFITNVIEGLRLSDGINIDYISPVNEPDGHWNWQGPKQEGTPATKYEIANFVRMLDNELSKRDIKTRIIIPESSDYRCMMSRYETGPDRGYEIQSFFSPDSAVTYLGGLNNLPRLMAGHSYWTNTPVDYMKECRQQLRDTLRKYGVDLWQSEVCIMNNDEEIGGGWHYDRTMKTALYVARLIHHDLVHADAKSWQWWRAIGGDYKDGLLFQYRKPHSKKDTIVDSKLLWSLGNYSRFIRPGAKRLDVTISDKGKTSDPTDPYGIMLSAFENNDGSIAVVAINYGDNAESISIAGLGSGYWDAYRTSDLGESLKHVARFSTSDNLPLPARSVTTFVSGLPHGVNTKNHCHTAFETEENNSDTCPVSGNYQETVLKDNQTEVSPKMVNANKISFKPIGTLLMDGALYCSPQKSLFPDGVNLPDVRLGVMASMGKWSAKIEIGYAYGKVLLKDIWMQYNFSTVDFIRAGLQMHHLGYQNSQAACMKVTMIEPISNTVFNEPHMIGVSWYHNADKYYTTLSAYVEPKSSSVILAKDEMIREGYGLRTRIVGRPIHQTGKMIQFGLSGAFETPRYTATKDGDTHDTFSFGANFPTKVASESAIGASVSHSMNLWKISPELMLCYGKFALESQYYFMQVNRRMSLNAFRGSGGYATFRTAIIGSDYTYNMGVAGIDTPSKGTLEGVVSYNYTKLSDKKVDIFGGRLSDISAGFNYYINSWMIAKIRYSYTHTWDRTGVSPISLNTFQARLQFIF